MCGHSFVAGHCFHCCENGFSLVYPLCYLLPVICKGKPNRLHCSHMSVCDTSEASNKLDMVDWRTLQSFRWAMFCSVPKQWSLCQTFLLSSVCQTTASSEALVTLEGALRCSEFFYPHFPYIIARFDVDVFWFGPFFNYWEKHWKALCTMLFEM